MSLNYQRNLSGLDFTPELTEAVRIIRNNQQGGTTRFYTTMGHVVTKILDMGIEFTLPDGSTYTPFRTVGELNGFLGITPKDYASEPIPRLMDDFTSRLHREKVLPRESPILNPRGQSIKNLLKERVWEKVKDTDSIDTLLGKIDELIGTVVTNEGGVTTISKYDCENLKEWIIMGIIGNGCSLGDWQEIRKEKRGDYLVKNIDKEKYTEYFADTVINISWRRNPRNPWHQMDLIQRRIDALYIVDPRLIKRLGKAQYDQFRNTRYV